MSKLQLIYILISTNHDRKEGKLQTPTNSLHFVITQLGTFSSWKWSEVTLSQPQTVLISSELSKEQEKFICVFSLPYIFVKNLI